MQQGDETIFQDAAATFRSLKLNDPFPAEGDAGNDDSSSSSSSNDEADVTLRMPPSVVMQVSSFLDNTDPMSCDTSQDVVSSTIRYSIQVALEEPTSLSGVTSERDRCSQGSGCGLLLVVLLPLPWTYHLAKARFVTLTLAARDELSECLCA